MVSRRETFQDSCDGGAIVVGSGGKFSEDFYLLGVLVVSIGVVASCLLPGLTEA